MDALPWARCPSLCTYVNESFMLSRLSICHIIIYPPCNNEETATNICALPLRLPLMQINRPGSVTELICTALHTECDVGTLRLND